MGTRVLAAILAVGVVAFVGVFIWTDRLDPRPQRDALKAMAPTDS
jgi:hypothetical protein